MDDDTEICKYGTPLEPLDEEELPRSKPPAVEEQYALDESGRRRFHGAFTGGFSAGFCNTVGSLEGWTPSSFKSSRKNKMESRLQKPEDFMDTEDREEWGIAPKRLQTTSDYTENVNKKKRYIGPQGPIPGDPVLQGLIKVSSDNIGVRLLKSMGWKEGQGTGPRRSASKHYDNCKEDISMLSELTFGPSDCENFEFTPKLDSFGMGYSGLDRNTFSKPFSLFEPSTLNIIDKNKKFSVQGQAFGIGAFEDEDEDIYHREDMSQYDFTLENDKQLKPSKKKANSFKLKCIIGFVLSNSSTSKLKTYSLPNLPKNYVPTCGKKTRFGPIIHNVNLNSASTSENYLKRGLGRHDLNPSTRRQIIEETAGISSVKEKVNLEEEKETLLIKASNITSKLGAVTTFKPFAADPEKEKRYNYFTTLSKEERIEKLRMVQPFGMTQWERERECREFEQALRLYKPLQGLMSDRFTSAGTTDRANTSQPKLQTEEEAANKKMFGKLTRKVESWQPVNLLCKRFNVPEPLGGCILLDESNKKSSSYSVFDYTESSVTKKKDYENENMNDSLTSNNKHIIKSAPQNNIAKTSCDIISDNNKLNECKTYSNDIALNKKSSFEKNIEQKISDNLSENKDLFKLIFAESSDSEDEDDKKNKSKEYVDEMKSYLLNDDEAKPKENIEINPDGNSQQESKIRNSGFGIFANVNLDALKAEPKKMDLNAARRNINTCENISNADEEKILFKAPQKTKSSINTFSTIDSSSSKKNKSDDEENVLDSKILAYLEKNKHKKLHKDLSSSSSKLKKSKKKHKLKEKKKKSKKKKSKKSKDKTDKRKSS